MANSLAKEKKKKWSLTPEAFGKLLSSFDPDRERAAEKYEEVRSGLICFFEWRGAPFPEEHADEAMNRVARKIDEGERVNQSLMYVYGVARMLLLEIYKAREREQAAFARLASATASSAHPQQEREERDLQTDCLERCLDELPPDSRDFLRRYYDGERRIKIDNRKRIAAELQIPLNALRLRARRLRAKLEICVEGCLKKGVTQ